VKIMHEEREWLKYLRHEAVVRALNPDPGRRAELVTERLAEAADRICDVLESTEIPHESTAGIMRRAGKWTREKVSSGIRFPRSRGPASATFFENLYEWVAAAAKTEECKAALDRVSYPAAPRRAETFAVAVANEVRGLLSEARRPDGQNAARYRMAMSVLAGVPDREVRESHARWRSILQALVAGAVAGLSSDFLFTDNWIDALGVGAAVATGAATREIIAGVVSLNVDMLAARRYVLAWLNGLPRTLSRRMEWRSDEHPQNILDMPSPVRAIAHVLMRGEGIIAPFGRNEPVIEDLDDMVRLAGEVMDLELRGLLIDLRRAMSQDVESLPAELTRILMALEGQEQLPGRPPPRPELSPGP
jgi:hypothetical protein